MNTSNICLTRNWLNIYQIIKPFYTKRSRRKTVTKKLLWHSRLWLHASKLPQFNIFSSREWKSVEYKYLHKIITLDKWEQHMKLWRECNRQIQQGRRNHENEAAKFKCPSTIHSQIRGLLLVKENFATNGRCPTKLLKSKQGIEQQPPQDARKNKIKNIFWRIFLSFPLNLAFTRKAFSLKQCRCV